jgi:hypothetical protein
MNLARIYQILMSHFVINVSNTRMERRLQDLKIREPLKNCWVLYRFDKINETIDNRKQFWQTFKFYYFVINQFLFVLFKIALIFGDPDHPFVKFLSNFDLFGLVADNRRTIISVYMAATCVAILSSTLLIVLNHSHINSYKWFDIIKALNGEIPMSSIQLYDQRQITNLVNKVAKLKFLLFFNAKIVVFIFWLFCVAMVLLKFELAITIYTPFTILIHWSFGYAVIINLYICFLYFFIVCSYCKVRIKRFNNDLVKLKHQNFLIQKHRFDQIIIQHYKICSSIFTYNRFWKNYLFAMYYFLTPVNLIGTRLIMFDKIMILLEITLYFFISGANIFNIFFNWFTASINHEFNKSYKVLYNCYLKRFDTIDMRRKIKLINAIERCSNKGRPIGFSSGDQFVMTRQMALKLFIIFLRYFLLTHKFMDTNR